MMIMIDMMRSWVMWRGGGTEQTEEIRYSQHVCDDCSPQETSK